LLKDKLRSWTGGRGGWGGVGCTIAPDGLCFIVLTQNAWGSSCARLGLPQCVFIISVIRM
jgi:hypothetical protein